MSVERLAELVRTRQPCVVLTGAGVSTESGISDFRSPTGIWARYDPMEYASVDAFHADPVKVWDFYARRLAMLADAEPNAGHHAIAQLEETGWVSAVVTQNIDLLHARAGSRSVVEVHGSIRTASCLSCYTRVPLDDVIRLLDSAMTPACRTCGSILKPDVVMFGEVLPRAAMERAYELARGAALMLVVGSSLEVWPVAGLPLEAAAFAVVNRGPTALDGDAVLKIDAPAGETLAAVAELLG
ncbi:MAG: NAD-dependent deacylase [Gaiellaceae bacterium]